MLWALWAVAAEDGCLLTARSCANFPSLTGQFRDGVGETYTGAGSSEASCLKRAEDLHAWCGNDDDVSVAATYLTNSRTAVYQPTACDKGWSLFGPFCYKHYWERLTWWDSDVACKAQDSHLASIHSKLENNFLAALTSGISAWMGYQDIDQDTNFEWTDKTDDNFNNWAKNCTGREDEPECKPEERKEQWYDWQGQDLGTYVCKKPAKKPNDIFVATPADLRRIDLKTALPMVAPQTLRLKDNNRTLTPLVAGTKPIAETARVDMVLPPPKAAIPIQSTFR